MNLVVFIQRRRSNRRTAADRTSRRATQARDRRYHRAHSRHASLLHVCRHSTSATIQGHVGVYQPFESRFGRYKVQSGSRHIWSKVNYIFYIYEPFQLRKKKFWLLIFNSKQHSPRRQTRSVDTSHCAAFGNSSRSRKCTSESKISVGSRSVSKRFRYCFKVKFFFIYKSHF